MPPNAAAREARVVPVKRDRALPAAAACSPPLPPQPQEDQARRPTTWACWSRDPEAHHDEDRVSMRIPPPSPAAQHTPLLPPGRTGPATPPCYCHARQRWQGSDERRFYLFPTEQSRSAPLPSPAAQPCDWGPMCGDRVWGPMFGDRCLGTAFWDRCLGTDVWGPRSGTTLGY